MVDVGEEAVFFEEVLGEMVKVVVGEGDDGVALFADEVVMGVGGGDFVDGLAVNLGGEDEAEVMEEVDGAVDGGAVDGGGLLLDLVVDLVDGGVAAHVAEGIDDDLALGGEAIALLA